MVDGVRGRSEVQEDEDAELAEVCRKEEVISYFKEGCFCAVPDGKGSKRSVEMRRVLG